MRSLVTSIFLYACESWTLTAELQRRLQATEMQRPCYQRGSPCQDSAGNRTTRRPDHRKETQTAVVWTYLPFTRSCQNRFARHSERRKKTRQTEEEVGSQRQEMDRPGVRQVPEGSGEQGKMEETGCEIICCALSWNSFLFFFFSFLFFFGGEVFETFFEESVDHIIYRDYIANRRSLIYCSLACSRFSPSRSKHLDFLV